MSAGRVVTTGRDAAQGLTPTQEAGIRFAYSEIDRAIKMLWHVSAILQGVDELIERLELPIAATATSPHIDALLDAPAGLAEIQAAIQRQNYSVLFPGLRRAAIQEAIRQELAA